jgi:hypothetical protein
MAPSAAISPSHRRGCERDFESAKLNGLDPRHYLADALARIRRPSPPAALRNSDLELANRRAATGSSNSMLGSGPTTPQYYPQRSGFGRGRGLNVNPSFLEKIVEADHCESPIGGLSGKYLAHHDRPRMSAKIKFKPRAPGGVGGRLAGLAVSAVLSSELSSIDVSSPAEILCSGGSTTTLNSQALAVPRAVFRCSVAKQREPTQHRSRRVQSLAITLSKPVENTSATLCCQYLRRKYSNTL